MTRGNRTVLLLPLIATALAASTAAEARGCFVTENDRRSISIRAGSDDAEVTIGTYPQDAVGEGNPTCIVSVSVKLGSFPTSRLATRPREVAESIRDVVAELKAKECRIVVWYVNDTQEERGEDEQCLAESFRFDGDSFWSSSSESNCWDVI